MSTSGMVYQRGHARDYDMWAELGNDGWSYNDMLPYFKKLECYEPHQGEKQDDYHGFEGPVRGVRARSARLLLLITPEFDREA